MGEVGFDGAAEGGGVFEIDQAAAVGGDVAWMLLQLLFLDLFFCFAFASVQEVGIFSFVELTDRNPSREEFRFPSPQEYLVIMNRSAQSPRHRVPLHGPCQEDILFPAHKLTDEGPEMRLLQKR